MRIIVMMGLLLACAPLGAAQDAAAVAECMRANLPKAVRIQRIELTAVDRGGGERVLKGRVFGRREDGRAEIMARIEAPADLSGSAYLVREAEPRDELYVYLPASNRVKRIAGGGGSGKLWGTDFSPAEFNLAQSAFEAGALRLVGTAQLEGRPVYRLAIPASPEPGEPPAYDAVDIQVDQATCVVLRADFMLAGKLRKRLSAPAAQLRQSAGKWYPGEVLLEDVVNLTRTRLRVLNVKYEQQLSGRYFHPHQFHLAY